MAGKGRRANVSMKTTFIQKNVQRLDEELHDHNYAFKRHVIGAARTTVFIFLAKTQNQQLDLS